MSVENLFHGSDYTTKLCFEDYTKVTEDFATMHVREDLLDILEGYGYPKREIKMAL